MGNNIFRKQNGIFYTIYNPFSTLMFAKWIEFINIDNKILLEPFAGSNNIPEMIMNIGFDNKWVCYDINPNNNDNTSGIEIIQKDTILNFPSGFDIVITNPPYLSKSSAKRNNIEYLYNEDDLYIHCINIMLKKSKFIAVIIPLSFMTKNIFHERLYAIDTLSTQIFNDTDCPVCLSLFIPKYIKNNNDFEIWENGFYKGTYFEFINFLDELKEIEINSKFIDWKFNIPNGTLGLIAIDNTKTESIKFINGCEIDSKCIKNSSRSITKISGLPNDYNVNNFVSLANNILSNFRRKTNDIFLTSFKGLRIDGKYRRRLDYNLAKIIMNKTADYLIRTGELKYANKF